MEYFFGFLLFSSILLSLSSCDTRDKNLEKVSQGMMSKVHYQGHTYVVWSINVGGGCVHDPDCNCLKKAE